MQENIAGKIKVPVCLWQPSPASSSNLCRPRVSEHKLVGKTKQAAGAWMQWKDPCVLPNSNNHI